MNNKIDIWKPEVLDYENYRADGDGVNIISDSPEKEKLENGYVSYETYKYLLDLFEDARNGGSGI